MLVDFQSLYERYEQDVHRFALYLSGDASLADDITQETFVRAWITPGEVRGGTVKAYLFMIAQNLYRSEQKYKSRHNVLNDVFSDRKPGPATVIGDRFELDGLLEALQSLHETDRAALLMHARDGMPYAEIAASLGLSVAAIKVRIHRARLKLKQLHDPKG